jgi:hypothetical protein
VGCQNSTAMDHSASALLRHVPQRASSGAVFGNRFIRPSGRQPFRTSERMVIILLFASCQPVTVLCSSTQVGIHNCHGIIVR